MACQCIHSNDSRISSMLITPVSIAASYAILSFGIVSMPVPYHVCKNWIVVDAHRKTP